MKLLQSLNVHYFSNCITHRFIDAILNLVTITHLDCLLIFDTIKILDFSADLPDLLILRFIFLGNILKITITEKSIYVDTYNH